MIMSVNTQTNSAEPSVRLDRAPAATAALSKVRDRGEWSISKVDEANIPVNIVISEPDDYSTSWLLLADNFKPCNSIVDIEIYEVEADTKEDLMAVVRTLIVPLYRYAVDQLEAHGHLFFWGPSR